MIKSTNVGPILYRIGRSTRQADIPLDDSSRTVSGLHAELFQNNQGHWFIRDCNSLNGSYLHRDNHWLRIQREEIRPHDRLRFGNYRTTGQWLIHQVETLRQRGSREASTANLPSLTDEYTRLDGGRYERDPETGEIRWRRSQG